MPLPRQVGYRAVAGLAVLLVLLACGPARAEDAPSAVETFDSEPAPAPAERDRVADYLRRKEERRAQREAAQAQAAAARSAEPSAVASQAADPGATTAPATTQTAVPTRTAAAPSTTATTATPPPLESALAAPPDVVSDEAAQEAVTQATAATAVAAGAALTVATPDPPPAAPAPRSRLPRALARAQDHVRHTSLGADPTVQQLLAAIDRQEASPQQLAAFGSFLAEHGLIRDALAYYEVALRLLNNDPVLWVNYGTLHRKLDDLSAATDAYARALSINPNYSLAHYNLGAVMDTQGKYEEAIEEYKIALRLDPLLGDPAYNPQAANNGRLIAVKLLLYEERAGNAGLPLAAVPEVDLGDVPKPAVAGTEDEVHED
jgi:hypothetical protein